MTTVLSVATPSGPRTTTCGYCSAPGQRSPTQSFYQTAGLQAIQLSCDVYQSMIDRGWRRSGTWCYKPDLRRSCCPQYTIKLDALEFKASKSQRKLVNRWNRFIIHGDEQGSGFIEADENKLAKRGSGEKSINHASELSLSASIHASESKFLQGKQTIHQFQTTLEPSTFTSEKYALYQRYQKEIHQDKFSSPSGFKSFLVTSPLRTEPIPYPSTPPEHLPLNYGSYHQMYRLDGQLIAVAVLDILPNCVSSVYFMYDNTWAKYSLGKLSALREVTLAREIREAGIPQMGFLYLGFYVHSCQKMRYKGEYSPSYLADPENYTWYPLKTCTRQLDTHRYACFSNPDHSMEGPYDPNEDETGGFELQVPDDDILKDIHLVKSFNGREVSVIPVKTSSQWKSKECRQDILNCFDSLGTDLSKDIIFYI